MPSNNWGSYDNNTGVSAEPVYPPTAGVVANPTGDLAPAQSPSGSVTGESATFNFSNTITSTEEELTNVLKVESGQQGAVALTTAKQQTIAGCPSVQVNTWDSGSVGSTGTKFS